MKLLSQKKIFITILILFSILVNQYYGNRGVFPIDSFLNFVSSGKGELKAKLLSSKELSKTELEKIRNELSKDFQSPIMIDYKHDPDLIVGLVIQVGSVMVDTSIKSKLRQLQKVMIEA